MASFIFYFHLFVSNCSELIIASGVVIFGGFEHTAVKKVFGRLGDPEKGLEKLMTVLCPHGDTVLPLLPCFTSLLLHFHFSPPPHSCSNPSILTICSQDGIFGSPETQEIVQKTEELRQECGMSIQELNQESKFKWNIQGEQEVWSVSTSSSEAGDKVYRLTVRPPLFHHVTV